MGGGGETAFELGISDFIRISSFGFRTFIILMISTLEPTCGASTLAPID